MALSQSLAAKALFPWSLNAFAYKVISVERINTRKHIRLTWSLIFENGNAAD